MIEPAAPRIRQRLWVPPIEGRGYLKTVRVRLHEGGITRTFVVAAFGVKQAAELLRCSELYLRRHGTRPTDDERERAESSPGRVWVRAPGSSNYLHWTAQAGVWV